MRLDNRLDDRQTQTYALPAGRGGGAEVRLEQLLGLGATNLLVLQPRLAAVSGPAPSFGRTVRLELVLGLAVLAVAAVLTGLAPASGR